VGAPLPAFAAKTFRYKYANNLSRTHPLNIRAREMAKAIKRARFLGLLPYVIR